MVIQTATNALAKIAYYADVLITIADIQCELRVYALPREYKLTYTLLLSRRWLQAVKAKGDYSPGQYYIMHKAGFRVCIPQDKKATLSPQRHRSHIPIVMRDKTTKKRQMSPEIEEELDYQQATGEPFFNDVVRKIIRQSRKQMKQEDEEEAEGEVSSEDSEN